MTRIEISEWAAGTNPPEDMPFPIIVAYDHTFSNFIFTLEYNVIRDQKAMAKLSQKSDNQLRDLYYEAVNNAVSDDAEIKAKAIQDREVILSILAGRGQGVNRL